MTGLVFLTALLSPMSTCSAAPKRAPDFRHGLGQVVGGLTFVLPWTVLEATAEGPPVVGTAVGLLAGTMRALQTVASGLGEMASAFDPWGSKRRHSRR